MSGLTAASAAEMRVLEELRQHEAAGVADTALRLREMDQARLHLQASVTRLQEDWEEFSSKHQVENATVTIKPAVEVVAEISSSSSSGRLAESKEESHSMRQTLEQLIVEKDNEITRLRQVVQQVLALSRVAQEAALKERKQHDILTQPVLVP